MLRENFCKHRWSVPALWKVGVFNKSDGEGLHGRLLGGVTNLQLLAGDDPW